MKFLSVIGFGTCVLLTLVTGNALKQEVRRPPSVSTRKRVLTDVTSSRDHVQGETDDANIHGKYNSIHHQVLSPTAFKCRFWEGPPKLEPTFYPRSPVL